MSKKYYENPKGINQENYNKLIHEFVNLVKEKGLTVRQAQKLFSDCSDTLLDEKMQQDIINDEYLLQKTKHINFELSEEDKEKLNNITGELYTYPLYPTLENIKR